MFTVSYGSRCREEKIREMAESDPTTAVILASVHFEWMIKRAILKIGLSPTRNLRSELEGIYKLKDNQNHNDYISIWNREVAAQMKKSKLGTVLGNLHKIQRGALTVRGRIIHGNGTVSNEVGVATVEVFIKASKKIREFLEKRGFDSNI